MHSSAVVFLRRRHSLYCSIFSSSLPFSLSLLFVLLLMILASHCPTAAVHIGELKHCFERYDGRRIVAASPFLSEWRRGSEEQCLEFCVRSASRCGAIVYDKSGHICHYFLSSDLANLVRQRKFVYLRVTDRNCTDSLKIKLVKESASKMYKKGDVTSERNGNSAFGIPLINAATANKKPKVPTPAENVQSYAMSTTPTTSTADGSTAINSNAKDYGRNRNISKSVPTISALLAELDAELAKQMPSPPPSSKAVADEAVLLAKIGKKGPTLSDKEIRRSPRISERSGKSDKNNWHQQNAKTTAEKRTVSMEVVEQQQLNEVMQERGEQSPTNAAKDSEQYIAGENHCDNSELTHRIWLAVENTRFSSGRANIDRMPQKTANTPRECVRVCTNLMVGPRPCNSFAFSEHEKRCTFGYSGNAFPSRGTLEAIRNGDFSQRTFRQFCFPASLSPFENCAEFLAFADYRLELEPREIFDGLPATAEGLSACIELCVLSSDFPCMSASFDHFHGICRLFHEHSLSNPNAFRAHQDRNQLYFENGCVESTGDITEDISQLGSIRRMRQKI